MKNGRKRVLFFMPDNPLKRDAGNKMRAYKLLEYFASRNEIEADFVCEQTWSNWTDEDTSVFREKFPAIGLHIFKRKGDRRNLVSYVLGYKIPDYIRKYRYLLFAPPLPDYNTSLLQQAFNDLLRTRQYDYIIISYVTWATLVKDNPFAGAARLIIDTHDFLTSQTRKGKNFRLGASFEEEMRRLSYFDEVWSLSVEENYLFRQFVKADHRIVPMMQDKPLRAPSEDKIYDIIYVASDNAHNVLSANWFFAEVYPLLPASVKICIIGSINRYIPANLPNITGLSYVEDTSEYYEKSKVAMCPMFGGTGIKIKTVEALAYSLPVVCTPDAIIGLPDKSNNGCIIGHNAEEFAARINTLLSEPDARELLSRQAGDMFARHFESQSGFEIVDAALGKKKDGSGTAAIIRKYEQPVSAG